MADRSKSKGMGDYISCSPTCDLCFVFLLFVFFPKHIAWCSFKYPFTNHYAIVLFTVVFYPPNSISPNIGSSCWHSWFEQSSGKPDARPQFLSSQPLPPSPNSIRSIMTQGGVRQEKVKAEKAAGERCVPQVTGRRGDAWRWISYDARSQLTLRGMVRVEKCCPVRTKEKTHV